MPQVAFPQVRVERHAFVEDEAMPLVMGAAALFKVLQNAAVELIDVAKALALQVGGRFFAANAACAKGHDRPLFQLRRQLTDGRRKVAEVVDVDRHRVLKCAGLDFEIVASVEQRDGPPFVQPLLQLAG